MAVMTSHQLEEVVLDQKIQAKMASDVEQKVNGVNGHSSPASPKDIVPDEPEPELTINPSPAENLETPADDSKQHGSLIPHKASDKNSDAFVLHQDLPEKSMAMDVDKSELEATRDATPKPDTNASSGSPNDNLPTTTIVSEDAIMEDVAPVGDHDRQKAEATLPDKEDDKEKATGDVEMKDVPEPEPATVPDPASSVDHVEAASTQNTSKMSDTEASSKPNENDMAAKKTSLAVPAFSDAPQSPSKVQRQRDDDALEGPPSKRARTERQHLSDLADASQTAESKLVDSRPAVREADQDGVADSNAKRDDWTRYKVHDREDEPLTTTMVKEAKKAIAGIKKTKVGGQLCKPIEVTWPAITEQYYAQIKKPMDFSIIDGKLKEGKYSTMAELKEEVDLIYSNAIEFNGLGHFITNHAHDYVERVMTALKTASHDKPRPGRKDSIAKPPQPKHHAPQPSREPRHSDNKAPQKPFRRQSHPGPAPAAPSPAPAKADESPTFAVPPSGMPLIRRDSTKNDGKRPIHPPKNKDLDYTNKGQKKKLSVELKFYEELLKELSSGKHADLNAPFLSPVDPVALNIPTYFNVIKKPMDLSTLAKKLETGEYKKGKDFEADMTLMFKNCFKFNPAGNVIHDIGKQFESLYKELLAGKDAWMKNNVPPPAPPKGGRTPAVDSDTEESEPEAELVMEPPPQGDDGLKKQQEIVKLLDGRVKEESKKLTEELGKPVPNESMINVGQLLVGTLMQQLLQEKKKLAELVKSPAPKAKATKAAKSKTGGASQKKAPAAGRKPGGGKKATKKRGEATDVQREVVTDGILQLDEANMNRCIEIIKKDTNQTENDSGELELDITVLSSDAVWKLFDIIRTKLPEVAAARLQNAPAGRQPTPESELSPPRQIAKAAKPKKNKPMNKQEQERKIEQLKELRAKFSRGGSGSQEPIPSVEDQAHGDSSDDEPSDSEEE